MKKGYIFALSLLASLPACCTKRCKPVKKEKTEQHTKQHIDTTSLVNMPVSNELEDFGKDEDARVLSFFEEDLEEFIALNDDDYAVSASYDVKDESDTDLFSWIDAQVEDEFKTVYFDFNRHGVRSDQKDAIKQTADQLKQILAESDTNVTIVVDGHTCQEGDHSYNIGLSEKRAKIVADMLVAAGIPQDKIKVVGRGQECPAMINGKLIDGTREDRWPNRRAEVHVIYT